MADINFTTTFNSYKVLDIIGEGGSGRVYRAADDNGTVYAIKCLTNVTKEKRKRFKNEIIFCQRNTHKNIVTVLEYGTTLIKGVEYPFYVMPYYSSTLRELMKGGISHNKVLEYFSQILDGVEAAHLRSVWHRDLKPENILHDPILDTMLVADFGIAHFSEEYLHTSLVTKPQVRLANFQYAAPEQRIIGKIVDHRADIFALGLILNEMFTGQVLQGTGYSTIVQVAPDYPYLDEIVDLMVRQLPEERPASIGMIKEQLIGREIEFISLQRLSVLKNTVVSQSEVDDPLVNEPVTLVRVDDYRGGKLFLTLSQPVTMNWVDIFQRGTHYRETMVGGEPNKFHFDKDSVSISIDERNVQRVVDYFKNYLKAANEAYKSEMLKIQRKKEDNERRRLQARIKEEETKQRILKNIKI